MCHFVTTKLQERGVQVRLNFRFRFRQGGGVFFPNPAGSSCLGPFTSNRFAVFQMPAKILVRSPKEILNKLVERMLTNYFLGDRRTIKMRVTKLGPLNNAFASESIHNRHYGCVGERTVGQKCGANLMNSRFLSGP